MDSPETVLVQLRKRAARQMKRIVFPESDDPRVVEAAIQLKENSWCHLRNGHFS